MTKERAPGPPASTVEDPILAPGGVWEHLQELFDRNGVSFATPPGVSCEIAYPSAAVVFAVETAYADALQGDRAAALAAMPGYAPRRWYTHGERPEPPHMMAVLSARSPSLTALPGHRWDGPPADPIEDILRALAPPALPARAAKDGGR